MRQTLSAALFTLFIPAAVFAQTVAPTPAEPATQVLSANPFGIIIKWFNAEYERKIGAAATFGASASHFGDINLWDAIVMVRWYPQQTPLEGFYVGVRAGAFGIRTYAYDFRSYHAQDRVLPGAGVELGYNWLLGPNHAVGVGTGFGLSRLASGNTSSVVPWVLPGFRLNLGIAF